jgi:hypothetical protein
MKLIILSILSVLFLEARSCSDTTKPEEPPLHINYIDCGGPVDWILPRAEAGDFLCVEKDDCYHTSGTPEGGCPNTCSCVCMYEVCYQANCTLVEGCTDPPVYR